LIMKNFERRSKALIESSNLPGNRKREDACRRRRGGGKMKNSVSSRHPNVSTLGSRVEVHSKSTEKWIAVSIWILPAGQICHLSLQGTESTERPQETYSLGSS
jgi:hypothetical protein